MPQNLLEIHVQRCGEAFREVSPCRRSCVKLRVCVWGGVLPGVLLTTWGFRNQALGKPSQHCRGRRAAHLSQEAKAFPLTRNVFPVPSAGKPDHAS